MKPKNILENFQALEPYYKGNIPTNFFTALSEFDVEYALNFLKKTKPEEISLASRKYKKDLQFAVKSQIPAYHDHWQRQGKIIDKQSYLNSYSTGAMLSENMRDKMSMISVSSGSSGKPSFWPRGAYLELETTILYELILKDFFKVDKRKTLLIDAYSMGMYVAGVFTLNACLRVAQRGYPLSVITPGISVDDILNIVLGIGSEYDQIILCGYPPFLKDVVGEGVRRGVDWPSLQPKFIFGAESVSEDWRAYLYKEAGLVDYYNSSINTYGSADAAILGHETPFSILIKQLASTNKVLLEELFGGRSVSTFVQYHPGLKYFESLNDELICSCVGGLPLLNYHIHDTGRVYEFNEMVELLLRHGIDIIARAKEKGISVWNLPFIVLLGKSDLTCTLYGLNIYPQTIRGALEDAAIIDLVTTRLTMTTNYNAQQDQYLFIVVELRKDIVPSTILRQKVKRQIFHNLLECNYEYKTLYGKIGKRVVPRVQLVPFGDKRVRGKGVKQLWIKK